MNISEIRVKLTNHDRDRLKAYCTVTLDDAFVVRDVKVIESPPGFHREDQSDGEEQSYFVAMPSRKLCDRCPGCGTKNHLRAHFCNECGRRLPPDRARRDIQGRVKLHADVAHPVSSEARQQLSEAVIAAYNNEVEQSQKDDYVPPKMGFSEAGDDYEQLVAELRGKVENREPREESRERKAESREPKAESREPREESREPRAESRERKAENREPREDIREPKMDSEDPFSAGLNPVEPAALPVVHDKPEPPQPEPATEPEPASEPEPQAEEQPAPQSADSFAAGIF